MPRGGYDFTSFSKKSFERDAIHVLARANVVSMAGNSKASGLPLKACADPSTIKLYFLDVGLYNSATGLEWDELFKLPADELLTACLCMPYRAYRVYLRSTRR